MNIRIACTALCVLVLGTACAQKLRRGDLLFHVTTQANAITDVTPDMIDHVAIVLSQDSVIEAIPRQGVTTTPLDSLRRQEGYYIIGRVRKADPTLSLLNARHYLGRPYDPFYLACNEAIYCSELVQFSYTDSHGRWLFAPIPMSFHDQSGRITNYWTQFYARHGMTVPEGQPGTNPAELSKRKIIKIIGRLK